ncbi:MAG TPA: L-ribulose-5-phosphate 4-epimerase AraD [Candidatus Aminicenantes bacterium]|nr:L-ribulose-5-phosphate 4-epimerase AraD [Candidatus Aminicenantes bacterium]HRY63873.1 L-ribulose-5-phosphate 4-epimerase AraD [Candidatus Aminicenantes bacterium]HRZ70786.1 L-ribulose-5-phosphate 4-epimerase AraD [Candidatus Aminicenantes bacterium]
MLAELKESVWKANLDLARSGLVILTFGNVSGIDRRRGIVAIKPSGVPYDAIKADDIVLVDLEGGLVEGWLSPSSDTPTHVELYKAFPEIGGVAHAHSAYATMFAQAKREIPCYGTTHADQFHGPVPLTRLLVEPEIAQAYERNTGRVIVERFAGLDPLELPAVLVAGHGPFTWGRTPAEAVETALVLEQVAHTAFGSVIIEPRLAPVDACLQEKHFRRKHGPDAYYGQKKEK